jgi:putative lumazine-binding protein
VSDPDDQAIADVLARYQLAVATGDRQRFASVFHPDATVAYPDQDTNVLVTVEGSAFPNEVADMITAGTTVKEETLRLRIDVAGSVATARVDFRLQMAEDSYVGTDFFTLAKLGDSWLITQKLYDMKPAPDDH